MEIYVNRGFHCAVSTGFGLTPPSGLLQAAGEAPWLPWPVGEYHSKNKSKQLAENKGKAKVHCQEIESWSRGSWTPLLEEQPQLIPNDQSQNWVRLLQFKGLMVPEAEMEAQQSLCSPALSTKQRKELTPRRFRFTKKIFVLFWFGFKSTCLHLSGRNHQLSTIAEI